MSDCSLVPFEQFNYITGRTDTFQWDDDDVCLYYNTLSWIFI